MKLRNVYAIVILLTVGCDELERPNLNQFVVEGFIIADASINDIKVKETVALNDSIQDIPIENAEIRVSNNEQEVTLDFNDVSKKYQDDMADFPIEVNNEYSIEISVNGVTASASTLVPEKPTTLALTEDHLIVPELRLTFGLRDQIVELFETATSTFTWEGVSGRSYFVVIENKEETLDPILPEGIPEESVELISSFRFISAPSESTSFTIIAVALETYGRHVAKVYSVNEEYVDLFNSETQDSRDLNDPPSNIANGLGIFTAFAVDSLEFEVRRE